MIAPASAGGFSTARFGGERGHAATNHVSAIYYNPAGLALGAGTRVVVEGLFAFRSVDYSRDPAAIDNAGDANSGTPPDAVAGNSGDASLRNFLVSPFIGVASDLGVEGLGVGLGAYVPFGGQASWDQNDAYKGNEEYPGAVDGSQRWAAIDAEQRALYITAAGSYRFGSKISVGAGLNVVSNSINLVRARNVDGSDDVSAGGEVKEGRSLIEASGTSFSVGAGIIVKPTPCSRIGISYQSVPGFGETVVDGTLTNKFGTGAESEVPIEVRYTLPDVIRLAGEWRAFTKASLHASLDYQRWSNYENTCIINAAQPGKCEVDPDGSTVDGSSTGILVNVVRNWKDTVTARVGGRYYLNDKVELNGGLTYDTSAVPDENMEPSLFDLNKVIAQVGGNYTAGKLDLSLTIGHVQYLSKTTAPSDALQSPSRNPDMAGSYKSFVTYALVGVGFRL